MGLKNDKTFKVFCINNTNTHDWPTASASEATALRRYTNLMIIIIIILRAPEYY